MTKQELNRDWKRVLKRYQKMHADIEAGTLDDWESEEEEIKKECSRLWRADRKMEYMNKTSILIFLRLNQRLRFETLHHIATHINILK